MNEKYREVEAWLERMFGGQPVPQYEITSRNLDILTELMHRNKQQDASAELVAQDLRQKAEEYDTEAERHSRILQKLGLSPSCLSHSGNISLKTLVDISSLLDVRRPSDSDILLAMSENCEEKMSTDDSRRMEQRLLTQLFSKTKAELQRSASLKKILENLEEKGSAELPDLENKAKTAGILQLKSREYQRSVEQLRRELSLAGADPSLYHTTLAKKSEDLKVTKDKLHSLKAKLDSYHALPPDHSLARVKVEEAKTELASLESELAQHIDLMHM